MKKTQKTIVCVECGTPVNASTKIDAIRREMDHYRLHHPAFYTQLLDGMSLRNLYRWIMIQIERRPAQA